MMEVLSEVGVGREGAGVSRHVGTSLQCLGIRSNNLLRNVWSRHSNAAVLSIRGADPSSHPLWDHCGSLWTSDRTGGILPVRTCHGTNKAQCDVVLIRTWQRSDAANAPLLFMASSDRGSGLIFFFPCSLFPSNTLKCLCHHHSVPLFQEI